jgi:hypothetical protein
MIENVLKPDTLRVINKLQSSDLPEKTYLAGGTAVALYLGHRRSADLDFFTPLDFVEKQWENKLQHDLGFSLVQRDWQTLIGLIDNVKFSLFGYRYPLIGPTEKFKNIQLASLPDLAAMKLDAVIGRGCKRDFIDLYFLCQRFGLETLFSFYQARYDHIEEKELLLKKSLVYFADADKDEMPDMLISVPWLDIKKFFRQKIRALA